LVKSNLKDNELSTKRIITGQKIKPELRQRARELRQQMTAAELMLWKHVRTGRLEGFHFRRQQVIDRFIVDFYCHQAELVVEVDGGIHLEQEDYDRERDRHLQALGVQVLRFTNHDVNQNLEKVLGMILEACAAGKKRPGPPTPAPP
jgi:very-short-patch-repair endonuclease